MPGRADLRRVRELLKLVAPGTPLREGLEHILHARTGALIVLGDGPEVLAMINGGFALDVEFSPGLLYELAKMDGAIVLDAAARRIRYANVQLVPDPAIPSAETGIRHRTAERVARQAGVTVIAISRRRDVITVYRRDVKYPLQDLVVVMARANQALQTLEKYAGVLAESLNNLTVLEFEDLVTLHDVATVLRRVELVLRLGEEIELYAAELGTEGRLIALQRDELVDDAEKQGRLLVADYAHPRLAGDPDGVYRQLHEALAEEDPGPAEVARLLGYGGPNALEAPVAPRGYRILHKIPRLPHAVVANLVQRFGSLQRILGASPDELDEVEGVGEARARAIREGLQRIQEQAFFGRRV